MGALDVGGLQYYPLGYCGPRSGGQLKVDSGEPVARMLVNRCHGGGWTHKTLDDLGRLFAASPELAKVVLDFVDGDVDGLRQRALDALGRAGLRGER